jgi:uncharacterized membrane protein YphA (DoxX/SURF4 family)
MENLWSRPWFPLAVIVAVAAFLVGFGYGPNPYSSMSMVAFVGAVIVVAVIGFGQQAIQRIRRKGPKVPTRH